MFFGVVLVLAWYWCGCALVPAGGFSDFRFFPEIFLWFGLIWSGEGAALLYARDVRRDHRPGSCALGYFGLNADSPAHERHHLIFTRERLISSPSIVYQQSSFTENISYPILYPYNGVIIKVSLSITPLLSCLCWFPYLVLCTVLSPKQGPRNAICAAERAFVCPYFPRQQGCHLSLSLSVSVNIGISVRWFPSNPSLSVFHIPCLILVPLSDDDKEPTRDHPESEARPCVCGFCSTLWSREGVTWSNLTTLLPLSTILRIFGGAFPYHFPLLLMSASWARHDQCGDLYQKHLSPALRIPNLFHDMKPF